MAENKEQVKKDAKKVAQKIGKIHPSRAWVCKPAPPFQDLEAVMPDGTFGKVSLSSFHGRWLVLFFYPLDFSFVCPTEIMAFSDHLPEFTKINTSILAVSCDSKFSHLAWTEKARTKGGVDSVGYPVASDLKRTTTFDYGVMHDDGYPIRGLFIIDPQGNIRHATLNDPAIGRDVSETHRVLSALQFADEHGEQCPANWHPGAAGIKPDHDRAKEYFASLAATPAHV